MSNHTRRYPVSDPGPRDYHLALVDDQDGPLTDEQLTWLDAVRPVRPAFTAFATPIAPTDIPAELRELAQQVEMALQHPAITPEARLTFVADLLRALADRIRP